jgi:hypothetical protein
MTNLWLQEVQGSVKLPLRKLDVTNDDNVDSRSRRTSILLHFNATHSRILEKTLLAL